MKKVVLLFFCALLQFSFAQNKSLLEINASAGISSPSSDFGDQTFAKNGSYFELSSAYYFSKLGVGLSIGQFSNPLSSDFSNQFTFPTSATSNDWKTTYFGIGPNFSIGQGKLDAVIYARGGLMSTKENQLSTSYFSDNADLGSIPIQNFGTADNTSSSFYNAGIKLGYQLNSSFSFYITSNYLSSTSDELTVENRSARFIDLDGDNVITEADILKQLSGNIEYASTSITTKVQSFNYGVGLTYKIPAKRTIKIGGTEKPYSRSKVRKPMQDIKNSNSEMNPSGTITFTNPVKERKNKQRKIVLLTPKNNSQFQELSQVKSFTWKTIGERIMQPKYGVTIEHVSNRNVTKRTYFDSTSKEALSAESIFKEQPEDGQYRWKVTELTTGTSSNYSYFNFSNCEIDFSISNEEIECLGYEGSDRKYKICFDATYSSPNGDLTFIDPGSGLSVYDQTYATLTYTLVSPNPTLVTQVGTATSTVSYCFEVTVDNTVTAIGFGLQGDDLDPSPIVCQPGVSASFDELPDCICDECEEIELSFDNFNISPNGTSGNQFNFNGNINVNVPIYGIEFQVQSYSYTATPSACSEGVSSLEESGMFLTPGTTINGSTTFQMTNESISGSLLSNDNATKNIKYTSNSPLSGPIPVNLTLGLPGPISGLDPSCCLIEYRVCIKVYVFYEEGNCKSCVFTHCFEFNNQ